VVCALLLAGPAGEMAWAGPISAIEIAHPSPETVQLRWHSDGPVDVFITRCAGAATDDVAAVSIDNRDGHITLADPGFRPCFILRDDADGSVRVAERVLPLERGSNFRDLGGYPADGGRHVRWGLVYRTAATPLLTPADVARVQALGLQTFVDLRSSEERTLAPQRLDHIPYAAVGYPISAIVGSGGSDMATIYKGFPALLAPHIRLLFRALLSGRGSVAFGCSAGQDRTGFAAALILGVLGVPRETILSDYHLSTTARRPEFEMPRIDPAAHAGDPVAHGFARYQQDPKSRIARPLYGADREPLLEAALLEVEQRWGSVEGYLRDEAGISASDIEALRAAYLE